MNAFPPFTAASCEHPSPPVWNQIISYMRLILSFKRTRGVAWLADWVVGADEVGRGDEYDHRTKGEKMHNCRSYLSFLCCRRKYVLVSLPSAWDMYSIYTSATTRTIEDLIEAIQSLKQIFCGADHMEFGEIVYMSHHRNVFNIINLTNWQQVRAFFAWNGHTGWISNVAALLS